MKTKKPVFLYGLGEKKSDYKNLEKYFLIPRIDWNTKSTKPKLENNIEVLIGFSFGASLACLHALNNKISMLILCSLPPGLEPLKKVRAEKIIFMVGEKEKWVIKDIKRLTKSLPKNSWQLIIVPEADHKIKGEYKKKLLEITAKINK